MGIKAVVNLFRPSDAYLRHLINHHWFKIGLSPGQPLAIIWTNPGIFLIGHLGTNFCEILIEIHTFLLKKMYIEMSSGKWRPCLSASMCFNITLWLGVKDDVKQDIRHARQSVTASKPHLSKKWQLSKKVCTFRLYVRYTWKDPFLCRNT